MENSDLLDKIDCIATSKHPVTSIPSELKPNAPEANVDGVCDDLSQETTNTNRVFSRSHSSDSLPHGNLTVEDVPEFALSTERCLKDEGSIFESQRRHPILELGHIDTTIPATRIADHSVIASIEDQIRAMMRRLQMKEGLSFLVRIKKRPAAGALASSEPGGGHEQTEILVKFPGQTAKEAWRIAVIVRLLELLHEALMNNVVVSKRNMYYRDPPLFKTQTIVDRYVDILACTLGVRRADLNVTAAAKGLVAGAFSIRRRDNTVLQVDSTSRVSLIGDVHDYKAIECSGMHWILVVEKESTFRTLVFSNFHRDSKAGEGIILTVSSSPGQNPTYTNCIICLQAKGYPDVSSRAFLRLLSSPHSVEAVVPPIFALVDFDPDGIAIMSTYKHGSWNLCHESTNLRVPSVRWLGLRSGELVDNSPQTESKGLLPLSTRDRRVAEKMLDSPILKERGGESEWRREIQVMLMVGSKAEMEILDEREGGVERWVEERLIEELAQF